MSDAYWDGQLRMWVIPYRPPVFSNEWTMTSASCQDEQPPYAETPEQADEILERLGHG